MEIITTTRCIDCPFHVYQTDSYDNEFYSCQLIAYKFWHKVFGEGAKISERENYFINFYKNGKVKSKNRKTLDNCPLLKESVNIRLI